jgi:hypothetical protein
MVSWNGHVVRSVAFAVCRWERIQIAMRVAVCVALHGYSKLHLQLSALKINSSDCIARGANLRI